jgi:uncharacterized membrane protein (DUF2068 family)
MDIVQYKLQAVVLLSYGVEHLVVEVESIHLLLCHYFRIVGVAGYLAAEVFHHCHPSGT